MCGRLSLTAADHRAAAELLADAVPQFEIEGLAGWLEKIEYQPRSNVGPGQVHFAVRGRRGRPILDRALWGFSLADKPGKLVINARGETVDRLAMFRDAFAQRRCLIPADGFFEWERADGKRLPWWFHREDGGALLFASILDPPAQPDAPPRFSIVTVPADGEVERIHDRMPAMIGRGEVETWLFAPPRQARALLESGYAPLSAMRVSERFNSVGHDGPIEALELDA